MWKSSRMEMRSVCWVFDGGIRILFFYSIEGQDSVFGRSQVFPVHRFCDTVMDLILTPEQRLQRVICYFRRGHFFHRYAPGEVSVDEGRHDLENPDVRRLLPQREPERNRIGM